MIDDLNRKEGISKVRKIIRNGPIGMLATNLRKVPFSVCPITVQEVDDKGDLWFFSARDSDHHRDISRDNRVQILFGNAEDQEYLSLYGTAGPMMDDKKTDKLWNPMLGAWFKGPDDPNLALMCLSLDQGFYWDAHMYKQVSFFKMADTAVSGENADAGEKGHINVENPKKH